MLQPLCDESNPSTTIWRRHDARAVDSRPAASRRWTARRKAQLVEAVQTGRLSLEAARRHYALSPEEYAAWERTLERRGVDGLMLGRRRTLCWAGKA